jgi:DNA-binding response OmpR family regulator
LYEYADGFLLVLCSAAEIEKRLARLVWNRQTGSPDRLLRLGRITLDTRIYEVRIDGRRVELAWMEFQLLKFLMENPGRIFTRDELLASVWRVDSFGGTRTVDVHIRRLRQKLGLRGNTYIRTVANVGYGLVDSWQFLCMPPPVGHRTTVPVSAVTRFLHGVSPLVTPWSSFRKKSRPSWENGP